MLVTTKRSEYFDILKGIGIIYVVLGHVLNEKYGDVNTEVVRRFIYIFHLPLFFFISGYFIKKECFIHFVKKKIKTLYFPCVMISLFSLILVPLWVRVGVLKMPNAHILAQKVFKILFFKADGYFVGACWFFSLLFISVILFELILQTDKYIIVGVLSFLGGILGIYCLNNNILDTQNINIAFAMLPFIFVGYSVKRKKYKLKKYNVIVGLIFTLLIFILNSITGYEVELSKGKLYGKGILFYPVSLMGIYLSCVCAKCINRFTCKKIFAYIGKHSNIIMMLHFIVFKMVDVVLSFFIDGNIESTIFTFPNYRWLYFIMGIVIPLFMEKCMRNFLDVIKRMVGIVV